MSNTDYDILDKAFSFIDELNLGNAIKTIKPFLDSHPYIMYDNELDDIEEDYRRMLGYMQMGYTDPERERVYRELLRRMYIFTANLRMAYRTQHERLFIDAKHRSQQHSFAHDRIKHETDSFVTDIAMLGFEPEDVRTEKEKNIYARHQEFMSMLFDDILVSGQWKPADVSFFGQLLLSPVTEQSDASLIISAITLSCISEFDINKFTLLVDIYKKATAEHLRQRALVGWVLSMKDSQYLLDAQRRVIDKADITDADTREIADLQKQMLFCMNAEKDNETIQRDIMPTLIRNNNLNITPDGIIEKDNDPMEDIIAPDAADKRMEEMENSMRSMMDMQKAGSDIYFGGFAQMKRFPFFYTVSNWFTPFYIKHPDLRHTLGKLENSRVMSALLARGPFCDSDKYSFTLAMATVIDRIPENIREMLGTSDNIMMPGMSSMEQDSADYIRRMYLQDLYRFFKLHPQREAITSPFSDDRYVLASSPLLKDTPLCGLYADLCSFFHKYHNGKALGMMLEKYEDTDDAGCMLLWAVYESKYRNNPSAAAMRYERVLEIEPDNEHAMSGLARTYIELNNCLRAIELYKLLTAKKPDNKSYLLNSCVAQIKAYLYDEAATTLYRLDYENPDDINVKRLLAWALMGQDKLELSAKEYVKILKHPKHNANDWLNSGYCSWFGGEITQAISYFKKFAESCGNNTSLEREFINDMEIIQAHGMSITDIRIMHDIISGNYTTNI